MTIDEDADDNAGSGEKAVPDVIWASVVTVEDGGDLVVVSVEEITGVEIEVDVLVGVLVTTVAVVVVGAVVEGVLVGEFVSGLSQSGG